MADDKLQQKLVDYVEDAHAMEQNVSRMLDSMMTTTDDPEITEILRHHKEETERHEQRLRERLDALGAGTSARKQAQTIATALMKGAADDEAMAQKIDANWDRFLDLTLAENDISTGPVSGVTDTVGGATDSVRGVTDNLLGGEEKQ